MTQLVIGAAAVAGLFALLASEDPKTLHEAARRNNLRRLRELLQQGHDPAKYNSSGDTPLHVAAQCGSIAIIEELLNYRSSLIYEINSNYHTPLIEAVISKKANAVKVLLKYDKSEIQKAIFMSEDMFVTDTILKSLRDRGTRILCQAARNGEVIQVMKILRCTNYPNCKDKNGLTPLHHASITGQVKCVTALTEIYANVNARDYQGDTPLHKAVKNNRLQVAKALIYANANRHVVNNMNKDPYELACTAEMKREVAPPDCSIL